MISIQNLKLSIFFALNAEVNNHLRVVVYKYNNDDRVLLVRIYLDAIPIDDDYDSLSSITGYVIGNYKYDQFTDLIEECLFSSDPFPLLETLDGVVYVRKEEGIEFTTSYYINYKENEKEILLNFKYLLQEVFLGEIYSNIKEISFEYDYFRKIFGLYYFLDRDPTEEDKENILRVLKKILKCVDPQLIKEYRTDCINKQTTTYRKKNYEWTIFKKVPIH